MADSKISQLTAAGALTGTETVPLVQSSTTKRATAQAIADLAGTTFAKTLLDDTDEEAAAKTLLWDNRYGMFKFHDCCSPSTDGFYSINISGTGANVALFGSTSTEDGILNFDLGTVATNRAGFGSAGSGFYLGNGSTKHTSKVRIMQLSNGTDTYTFRAGLLGSYTGDPSSGAYFRYTDSVNSGRFQAVLRSGGIETAIDTGVSPNTSAFQVLRVETDATGSTITFYIDGTQVAQSTSNAPGTTQATSGINVIRSAGTTNFTAARLDYIKTFKKLTTPRT